MMKRLDEKEMVIRKELEAAREELDQQVDVYADKIAAKVLGRPVK